MNDLKKKVEAILFSTGKYISLEEISRLCKKEEALVKEALLALLVDYEQNENTSLVLINEGDVWKLTTREEYGHLVREIIAETELTKSQMETLAVVAFKYPIKQSELIKIRTNKAYDHVSELEKLGFITRQKYGRSRLIKLTDKFFDYFDLPREKLKERFKGFEQLATTIENKEEEMVELKEEQQKRAKEAREEAEMERKFQDGEITIEEGDDTPKVQIYGDSSEDKNKLGDLEIVEGEAEEETEDYKRSVKEVLGVEEKEEETQEEPIKEEVQEEQSEEPSPEPKEHIKSVDEIFPEHSEEAPAETKEEPAKETEEGKEEEDENSDSQVPKVQE